jgi:asparagine synthase (glutamine-hydrolysing)
MLRHRGPDDDRIQQLGGAVLGHRRLSIIDIAGSAQPMHDSGNRYALVYNGEIYNYAAIRSRLSGRWTFSTHGDTEVLLAGLVLEGANFLNRLDGMWAFAFWDMQARRLLLGRDRMGEKPLFFRGLRDGGFACASELPALRRLTADETWCEDAHSTADYFRYGYSLPGFTLYRGVYEVLPGHCTVWAPDGGGLRQHAYWRVQPGGFSGSRKDAAKRLRTALVEAVDRRLVADVEVGAFLSGGVDSSLVCAIVRHELKRPIKTFTIGFRDATFDERSYASLVAKRLGTQHHEEVLDANLDEDALTRLVLNHVGQPFSDASILPAQWVSAVAARHVKVALSGDGGDELFCGYQRYQARNLWRWYSRLPLPLRRMAEKALRKLPEPMAHHSRSLLKKAHLYLDFVAGQDAGRAYLAPLMFLPQELRRLAPALQDMGQAPPGIPRETDLHDVQRMMLADTLVYLPQDILVKMDRAAMSQTLETRTPFLDREVVELALSLPFDWHSQWLTGKRMLFRAFHDLLPRKIWRRRKQGFAVPIHAWFSGALGERLDEMLAADPGPLQAQEVHALLRQHRDGTRDHSHRLWLVFNYLLWRRNCG